MCKYLNDAAPAKYDTPVYFTFCTLKNMEAVGIEAVPATRRDNGAVFTLQGVRVGSASDWNSLPSGIYIIDGKKMLKR